MESSIDLNTNELVNFKFRMEAGFFARRVFRRELEKIKFQLKSLKGCEEAEFGYFEDKGIIDSTFYINGRHIPGYKAKKIIDWAERIGN